MEVNSSCMTRTRRGVSLTSLLYRPLAICVTQDRSRILAEDPPLYTVYMGRLPASFGAHKLKRSNALNGDFAKGGVHAKCATDGRSNGLRLS